MKKKVLVVLVLLVLIGTSAVFAQRVGDLVQLDGQPYVVESVSGDRVVLQRASINGVWARSDNPEVRITVSGSTGTWSSIGHTSPLGLDAINKGYIKIGGQAWQNLRSTGNLTWSGQESAINSNRSAPNVATGTGWVNCTITMSADGRTITVAYTTSDGRVVYTRR